MATAVLHNLAVLWNEEEPDESDEDDDKDSDISENSDVEYVPGRSRDGRFELQKITGTRLHRKLDGTYSEIICWKTWLREQQGR